MISLDKKFIFIHIPRTGGTSANKMLKEYSFTYPRIKKRAGEYSQKHWGISEFEKLVNIEDFFKCSVVRNPFDRMVSIFHWGHQLINKKGIKRVWINKDFKKWVVSEEWINPIIKYAPTYKYTQSSWLRNKDGNICMDKIIRFEDLEFGWNEVLNTLKIKETLTKIHSTERIDDYKKYYNGQTKDIVYKHFNEDIERFNYEF